MSKIVTELTSSDAELQKSLDRAQQATDKWKQKYQDLAKASKVAGDTAKKTADEHGKSADKAEGSMQKMVGSLVAAGAGYFSLNGAIRTVVASLQDQLALQDKIANVQKSGAEIERGLLRNLGNISKQEQTNILSQMAGMSKRSGVNQDTLKAAAAEAVSARGNLSISQALQHVEAGAKIAPENAGELAASSRALMNISGVTGSADPKRNLAYLTDLMSQSPSSKLADISQNALPGIVGVQGFGGTAAEAGGLTTAMASAMKDTTMASSSTAAIQLARQVEGFTKGGPAEDIKFLQEHPSARDAFLKKASFEAKAIIPSRDMLTAGTPAAKLFAQNMGGFTPEAGAGTAADAFVERLDSTPLQQAENFRRKYETQAHTCRLEDIRSGDFSRIRGAIDETMQSSGTEMMARTLSGWRGQVSALTGGSPEQAGLAQISHVEGILGKQRGGTTDLLGNTKADEQIKALQELKAELIGIRSNQAKRGLNVNAHVE